MSAVSDPGIGLHRTLIEHHHARQGIDRYGDRVPLPLEHGPAAPEFGRPPRCVGKRGGELPTIGHLDAKSASCLYVPLGDECLVRTLRQGRPDHCGKSKGAGRQGGNAFDRHIGAGINALRLSPVAAVGR